MKHNLFLLLLLGVRAIYALRCFNFYGFETPRYGLVCDWKNPPLYYLTLLKSSMGVDTIRLPFSRENILRNAFYYMDNFISDCASLHLNVILDYHRTWSNHQGPHPEENITTQDFINAWVMIAYRYYEKDNVIGLDIFNEYQGWNSSYIIGIQNRVIRAIEEEMPGRYLFFVGCVNWGTDCEDFRLDHFTIAPNRLFVTVHKYIFTGSNTVVEWDRTIPRHIPASNWFIGEVGWRNDNAIERQWAESFLAYLSSRDIHNVCAWTIAHSDDTGGWWKDDCESFQTDKVHLLTDVWTDW